MAYKRAYVILHPVEGQASGFVRWENLQGRARLSLRAAGLPDVPLRALLLAGDDVTGAVLDLGPVHNGMLSCSDLVLPAGYHTLVLAQDWPGARVLLYGWMQRAPGCTLWQVQAAVAHYLSVPAADGAAASQQKELPRPVLRLRCDST